MSQISNAKTYFETNALYNENEAGITFLSRSVNHAQILVEWMDGEKKIEQLIDLGSVFWHPFKNDHIFRQGHKWMHDKIGIIRVKPLTEKEKLAINGRGESFIVTKEKAQKFVEKMQKQNRFDHPFCLLGSTSKFNNEKALVIEIRHPMLEAINQANHKLFKCLYDSMKNNFVHTGMSKEQFNVEISDTLEKIYRTPFYKDPDKIGLQKRKFLKDEDEKYLDVNLKYDDLMKLMHEHTGDVTERYPDNCCSWATKQIEEMGIELKPGFFDSIITGPWSRADHRRNSNVIQSDDLIGLNEEYHSDDDTINQKQQDDQKICGKYVNYDRRRSDTPEIVKQALKDAKSNINDAITTTAEVSGACLAPMIAVPFVPKPIKPIITSVCLGAAAATAAVMGVCKIVSVKNQNKKIFDSLLNSQDADVQAYRGSHPEKFKDIDPNSIYKVLGKGVAQKIVDEAKKNI